MNESYGPYAGICYDGPQEGQRVVSNHRSFAVPMLMEYTSAYIFSMYEEKVPYRVGWYHWSGPLRKWVFEC